jgi:hypothetical protein
MGRSPSWEENKTSKMPKGGRLRGKKADGESTGGPAGSLIKVKDLRAADRRFQQIPVVTLEVHHPPPPPIRPG